MTGVLRSPRTRHGLLAAALLALAAIQAADGDWWWATVFGLAAVTEAVLLLLAHRRPATAASTATAPVAVPDREAVALSVRSHRQGQRLWQAVVALALVGAVAMAWSAPSLAAVLAAVTLFALTRVRRQRRTVTALRSLPTADRATGAAV